MNVTTAAGRSIHWRAHIDTVIAVLRLEPDQLGERGLRFEDDHDGLDALRHARLETRAGKVFALVRHRGAPRPGTEIVTRDDSPSLLEDLEDVLLQLRLTRDDLVWEHPTIRALRHAEGLLPDIAAATRVLVLATTVSVIGAGLVLFSASDDRALLRMAGVGLIVIANLTAVALVVPAYRRVRGLLPSPRGSLLHRLRRLWSRRRTSSGRPVT